MTAAGMPVRRTVIIVVTDVGRLVIVAAIVFVLGLMRRDHLARTAPACRKTTAADQQVAKHRGGGQQRRELAKADEHQQQFLLTQV